MLEAVVTHSHVSSNSLVAILFPIVKDISLISTTFLIGLLFAIAFFIEEKKGYLQPEALRVKKLAQLSAVIWISTLVGSIFIELANILDESLVGAFNPTVLRSFLRQTVIGRSYLAQLIFGLIAILLLNKAKKVGAIYGVLVITLLATILPIFQSHSSGLSNHTLAIGSLVFHVIFITLWVGGVLGLIVIAPQERVASLKRFSSFALCLETKKHLNRTTRRQCKCAQIRHRPSAALQRKQGGDRVVGHVRTRRPRPRRGRRRQHRERRFRSHPAHRHGCARSRRPATPTRRKRRRGRSHP
ncbi:MAG: hypothetical protein WCJ92_08095 [Alphaproteobacteria bacterium]